MLQVVAGGGETRMQASPVSPVFLRTHAPPVTVARGRTRRTVHSVPGVPSVKIRVLRDHFVNFKVLMYFFFIYLYIVLNDKIANILKKNLIF